MYELTENSIKFLMKFVNPAMKDKYTWYYSTGHYKLCAIDYVMFRRFHEEYIGTEEDKNILEVARSIKLDEEIKMIEESLTNVCVLTCEDCGAHVFIQTYEEKEYIYNGCPNCEYGCLIGDFIHEFSQTVI